MARGIAIKVTKNRLGAIADILPRATGAIVNKHGQAMEATAKRLVPVDTGALQASIQWRMVNTTDGELTAGGGDVNYEGFVEFGTRHMAAQPYLRPAVERERGPFMDDMRRLEDALR